jgi:5-methylcytosine-specific restriction endonuclease McrA
MAIPEKIRSQVIEKAGYRCEYCQTNSRLIGMPLIMEHILPKSAGGKDELENLAACCYRCNEFKGAKTHTTDPQIGQLVPLFNPRQQLWQEHFNWVNGGTHIAGITPISLKNPVSIGVGR